MSGMVRIEDIIVEMDGTSPFEQINAQQGDNDTLIVRVQLLIKKQPYVPAGIIPRVLYRKPDGKKVENNCEIQDGKVIIEYTNQMLTTAGNASAQIVLFKDGKELKSPKFYTKIYPAAIGTAIEESTDEYMMLADVIDITEKQAEIARTKADEAATSAADAKKYAEQISQGIINDESESKLTTYSSEKITKLINEADSAENTVTFESYDSEEDVTWTDVPVLSSAEKHKSIFGKISTMFKNVRYLYKMLGTTDISSIEDGTLTGAVAKLNSNLSGMMCLTNVVNVFNDSFSAYEAKGYEVDVPNIEGYTAIGIVGLSYNNVYVQCTSHLISNNKAIVYAYNTLDTTFNNAVCNAIVLYTKNINL